MFGIRITKKNETSTAWYVDQSMAHDELVLRLDELNHGEIESLMAILPDGSVKPVKKTIQMTYVIMVEFVKGGKLYPYESAEDIPCDGSVQVLADGAGVLRLFEPKECYHVPKADARKFSDGRPLKKILAIAVKSMEQVKKIRA